MAEEENLVWFFGYGSLMWNTENFDEYIKKKEKMTLEGYERRFTHPSTRNWGDEDNPAPTCALEESKDGKVDGIAYGVEKEQEKKVYDIIKEREGREGKSKNIDGKKVYFWPMSGKWKDKSIEELAELAIASKKGREYVENVRKCCPDCSETERLWEAIEEIENREKDKDIEIVEEYKVKQKPELNDELKRQIELRRELKKKTPRFLRQEWFRYKRLREHWRRPTGLHSKMRRHFKFRINVPSIGYRSPRGARNLHPSGFKEVLIHNVKELEGIDPKTEAVRIAHSVGTRKRIEIELKADELGIRVLNRRT